MARLSNCGKSETGGLYGEPGDQTRQEYWNIGYWANGWQYVFRYPSESVASLIALYAQHAAENDKIGYSQSGRTTMWQQISFLSGTHDPAKIQNACNADCSSSTMAIIRAVGLDKNIPALSAANINGTTYSMIGGELESMGFKRSPFGGESMLNTGDILMTDGHACIVIEGNQNGPYKPAEKPQVSTIINNSIIPKDVVGRGIAGIQGILIYVGFDPGRFRDRRGVASGVDGDAGDYTSATNNALKLAIAAGKITEAEVKKLLELK